MGAGRPASRMRPVELVDGDDIGPPSTGAPSRAAAWRDDGSTAPGVPARRWWPWATGALAVVVAAGAVATVVTERAARARADLLAGLPGLVRPLESAPTVLWRAPVRGPTPVTSAGGAIVTVSQVDERWTVGSHDPASGAVRWQVPVVGAVGAGYGSVAVTCEGAAEVTADLLCAWEQPDALDAGRPATRIVALDPADGAERGAWQIESEVLGIVRHEDAVVVATALPDRRVLVERRDASDGTVRWSWTSPGPLVDRGGVRPIPTLRAGGDVVALLAHSTAVLDSRTGRVLEQGPPGRQILVGALPGGGYATWSSGLEGQLRDADGTVRATVPALPVPVVGDGSLDGLLVDAGNRLLAVSARDGATAWSLPTSMTPVAVADGVAVLRGDASVGAVDVSDGRLLWEQELAAELRSRPLTDGLHVLVAQAEEDDGRVLVARGLRDGVEAWRVALPAGAEAVAAVGGHVVAVTATEVLVLG